ncbi:MAG: pyruvate, phosphate dikinase [Bacteroidales bacterium]|nr:pyruvate, phosphate dikinase [Bacteroidales bacterium]
MKDDRYNKPENYQQLLAENKERLKELACINNTSRIIKEQKSIEETLQKIALDLPRGWQYPEYTVARIIYDGKEYRSADFKMTPWYQKQKFHTIENKEGAIEVFYTKKFSTLDEGPFLKEERDLLMNLANIIVGYINSGKAKEIIGKDEKKKEVLSREKPSQKTMNSRQLLQKFINNYNADRDILHDLMPFKVKEILLVANLYDAFSIEKEGRFTDHILGEYHQLNLTSLPRVTGVSNEEDALRQMEEKHFDMVILMMGVDKKKPFGISKTLKKKYPYVPLFLLLNNNTDLEYVNPEKNDIHSFDNIFVWNGDSKVFFTMVKLLEDRVNLENDTKVGLTRVILLVEDSIRYYSRYLPMLYQIILEQTKRLIEDVNTDDLYKVLKLRTRPKIILASSYEEAMNIFNKYKDYFLFLISDIKFPRNGEPDSQAGYDLIQYARQNLPNLPTILQSSNPDNAERTYELRSNFINKNSETLLQDLKSFINYHLGFGHFVYRDNQGRQIAVAKSMDEFESYLKTVPSDSLVYHAVKNQFSLWLMARGEIQIAKIINPLKISDFDNAEQMRNFLINILDLYRKEQEKGKIVNFSEHAVIEENNIVSLAPGALGGKGRGVAFINTLIYNFKFNELLPSINLRTPRTAIVGTDEFDIFLEKNKLGARVFKEQDYEKIKLWFLKSELSFELQKRIKIFLKHITKPLAVRSSSLFEDSITQPFSGVFDTYVIPNNHPDFNKRYRQLADAIKLVYASIYSDEARNYFRAVGHKVEEEKMAVIIQELVGNQYEHYYYPHISGTAQSHNYYPIAHMKPDEGFAVAAVGLGQYVVDGEQAYRFSPSYPQLQVASTKDLLKTSQVKLFAVDLNKKEIDLAQEENAGMVKIDIDVAEKHGNLKHCASVYEPDNDRLVPGVDAYGPRVINFANILKFNYIPLAQTIKKILDIVKEALGTEVEIEWAVDLNRDTKGNPSFYLLQIKPMVASEEDNNINVESLSPENVVLFSERSMGHGRIDTIKDVIFTDIDNFDNNYTLEMTYEIEKLNEKMYEQGKQYVLIGPGRWGTRDKFIGIPVVWSQISNAKVIVEVGLEDYPLDASLGSHFFHNLTSMNVGYFSIANSTGKNQIAWEKLENQRLVEQTRFFKHIEFDRPLSILMDGKKMKSAIIADGKETNAKHTDHGQH